jgi:small subunit ribosomal protein S15Ae
VIQLNGRVRNIATVPHIDTIDRLQINKTGVISPRYNVQLRDLEKWVVKLLPSRQFGYIVLTTSAGIMDHEEARRKHVAGKILGFFY